MRDAAKAVILAFGAAAIAGCNKQQTQNQVANQEMSIDGNLAQGELPPNAEIETLPPDESSGTSSGELNAGDDNPDVNDLSNSH
jgi:hypothetical protein